MSAFRPIQAGPLASLALLALLSGTATAGLQAQDASPETGSGLLPASAPAPGRAPALLPPGLPSGSHTWQLQSFAEAAGLASERVFDAAVTNDGGLWLASSGGLFHYDGYSWRRYGRKDGIPSDFVRCVFVTEKGALWVGTDHGAGRFEPASGGYQLEGTEVGLDQHSVRHINQDPDGSLWFSCDQWPDTSAVPGALVRLTEGKWTSFTGRDGLPMHYVIGRHRDSQGVHRVFTAQGWVEGDGNTWRESSDHDRSLEQRLLEMVETRDGVLLAQGENGLLARRDGIWRRLSQNTKALLRSNTGEIYAAECDATGSNFWISHWNGTEFIRLSARIPVQLGTRIYALREAADNSLWCVGTGLVLRWDRNAGPWTAFQNLPPPLCRDTAGRLWFHGKGELVWKDDEGFHRAGMGLERVLGIDADGSVIGLPKRSAKPVVFHPERGLDPLTPPCPLTNITHACADRRGRLWLLGTIDKNELALAHRDGGPWKLIRTGRPVGGFIFSLRPHGETGVCFTLVGEKVVTYDVWAASDQGVAMLDLPRPLPPIAYPTYVEAAGETWLHGYSGLFRKVTTPTPGWERVPGTPTQGFNTLTGNSHELVTVFQGAEGAFMSFDGSNWRSHAGDFSSAWLGDRDERAYLRGKSGIYVRPTRHTHTLDYLPLPSGLPPHMLVEDNDGSLWVGTSEGVLHYTPDPAPPETALTGHLLKISHGNPLPVVLRGIQRNAPSTSDETFQFSWRIDDAPWGPFLRLPDNFIPLEGLRPGPHRLEVRARDADGDIDATPARLDFTLLPLPLQSRPWFPWALGGLTVLVTGLVWLGVSRSRRLARRNTDLRIEIEQRKRFEEALQQARDELEQRVLERTTDLRRANEELVHEIHERQQVEKLRLGLEEQLLQAQKIQAIGTLAGGIAHDFNNILAIIMPCTRMALEECFALPEARENLRHVLAASERARLLVQQILTFSRRHPTNKQRIDLGETVREAVSLLRSALGAGVHVELEIEGPLPPILADATQIHQVVINLCSNAQHALKDGRGHIRLLVRNDTPVVVEEEYLPSLAPEAHIALRISDTGCGIEPDIIERIFDPFFTTKPVGQGTGLGLSVVDGIVKAHGGHITVESTPGQGSTFTLFFPILQSVAAPVAAPAGSSGAATPSVAPAKQGEGGPHASPPPTSAPPGEAPAQQGKAGPNASPTSAPPAQQPSSGPHILIVDDEPSVSRPMRIILERAGFKVTVHETPEAAQQDFEKAPESFHLLLTDHTMAGMTGPDLAGKLRQRNPALPVVMITGLGAIWNSAEAERMGICRVLTKPVGPAELVAEIREVMSEAGLRPASSSNAPTGA